MQKFLMYSGFAAGVIFIGMGLYLLSMPAAEPGASPAFGQGWLGYVIVAYGAVRLFRSIWMYKKQQEQDPS
jgi:hypothetical protein